MLRTLLFCVALPGVDPVIAQQYGSERTRVAVRVIGEDGLPRPGVPVYVTEAVEGEVAPDDEPWVVVEDPRIPRLRDARALRTDPEGRMEFDAASDRYSLRIGEPFVELNDDSTGHARHVITVRQNEPLGVLVVDDADRPQAGFPVALRVADRDEVVALTDETGRALLGLPEDFDARAVVVPAGWLGPTTDCPSVSSRLPGHRGLVLRVPPHGQLRLRTTRAGFAVRGMVSDVAPQAIGIVYPFVALGVELECALRLHDAPSGRIRCRTPRVHGECATVDVELGPLLTFSLTGPPVLLPPSPRVRLVTDRREFLANVTKLEDGTYVIDPGCALPDTRISRIDVDWPVRLNFGGRLFQQVSGSRCVDCALDAVEVSLGAVEVAPCEPQLRGRVVDAAGQPVAGVRVIVSAEHDDRIGDTLRSDADGRFQTRGGILRGSGGVPLRLVAKVRDGDSASDTVLAEHGEALLVLRPATAAETESRRPSGKLVARLTGLADPARVTWISLVSRHSASPISCIVHENGDVTVTFEGLRAGTYRLVVPTPDSGLVKVLDGLEVTSDGECADVRLDGVDCRAAMRVAIVEVVDPEGVPVARAGLNGPELGAMTDGAGFARIWVPADGRASGVVSATGLRPVRVEQWGERCRVQLEPAGTLQVVVRGLPADLPRARLEVALVESGPFREIVACATLDDRDTAKLTLPARGSYRPILRLLARPSVGENDSLVHGEPILTIGDPPDRPIEFRLTEAELSRLRELLAR